MRNIAVLFPLLLALVAGCSVMAERSAPAINFTGVWKMDRELSGRPVTLKGINEFKPGEMAPGMDLMAELQSDQLDILQLGDEIQITYGNGQEHSFNWSKRQHGPVGAAWQDDQLVVTYTGPGKARLVRKFIAADAGKSLVIVTVFNKMSLTQMYHIDAAATAKKYGKGNAKTPVESPAS